MPSDYAAPVSRLSGQAWITRLRFGAASSFYRDDLVPEYLDRFSCQASGEADGAWTVRFGPPCVDLQHALEWAADAADHVWLDEPSGRRWQVNDPVERSEAVACLKRERQLRWDDLPLRAWTARCQLTLGALDFEKARIHLRSAAPDPSVVIRDLSTEPADCIVRLQAELKAPTLAIASDLAAHLLQSWACGASGLRDELCNSLGVDEVAVRSADGLLSNDDE